MKSMPAALMAMALAAPSAGQAQNVYQDFCWGLKRAVEAAQYEDGFHQLERSRAAPPHLGFRHGCRATGDEKRRYWLCHQNLAPAEMGRDALARRIADCLPEAVAARAGYGGDLEFTLPHARIHVAERGGPGAKVGRIVTLTVEAVPMP